jgi:hypothetical protein
MTLKDAVGLARSHRSRFPDREEGLACGIMHISGLERPSSLFSPVLVQYLVDLLRGRRQLAGSFAPERLVQSADVGRVAF